MFWSLIFFILAISIVVGLHECGHFITARLFGVKVERFSFGFGKILYSHIAKNGTEYAISLIPLGGYVKMLDGNNTALTPELHNQAFNHKPRWVQFVIILAGPFTNIILAIILYASVFATGVTEIIPVIEKTVPHSIVAEAKLPAEMQIVQIDNEPVNNWQDVILMLISKQGNKQVSISLQSPSNTEIKQKINLNLSNWQPPATQNVNPLTHLGIIPKQPAVMPVISKIMNNSPAAKVGLKIGDEIIAIDQQNGTWQQISTIIKNKPNQQVVLEVKRNQQIFNLEVKIGEQQVQGQKYGYLGVSPSIEQDLLQLHNYSIFEAIIKANDEAIRLSKMIIIFLGKLITGQISLDYISGPISIAKSAGYSATAGLSYYLSFLAILSLNLGIMNLLPLPVLDGGHLFFLLIEATIRQEVPRKIKENFYLLGVILLIFLTIISIFYDIIKL